jgi:DNA-binding response OmpR family regulator
MNHKYRILLVDDEPLVREELGALLQDEGYEIITAADGDEGVDLFRKSSPDFVITDVRMPRRDGLSLAMTIRRENPTVPITIITGHGTETLAIDAIRAGVTDFIKKPVRPEELSAALHRMEAARDTLDASFHLLPESVTFVNCVWTYHLKNDLSSIPPFVDLLLKKTTEGMDRASVLELSLALRELLVNAIEHGNLGISYEEKSAAIEARSLKDLLFQRASLSPFCDRQVMVTSRREAFSVSMTITDQGEGFNWRGLPDPSDVSNLYLSHGRGILLARLSVDDLSFNKKGTEVSIKKTFKKS